MTPLDISPKLGCRLPVNKPALVLSDFFTAFPPTPPVDYLAYRTSWPWWLNNVLGTCVAETWAAVKALVSAKLTGREVLLTDADVLAIYRTQNPLADPRYPGVHDNGMDIQTLLEYLQKKGEIIAFGKIALGAHDAAISALGFEWTSIAVRAAFYDDYNARRPCDYHPLSPIRGYHSVMSAGHRDTASDDVRFQTWTRENGFTQAFWTHDVGATWGVILPEHLGSARFMAGMDLPALAAAFLDLTGRVLPIPTPPPPAPIPPYTPRTAMQYVAAKPFRFADSRGEPAIVRPPMLHRGLNSIQIGGIGGVPLNATAVALKLEIIYPSLNGWVEAGPDSAKPLTSVNWFAASPVGPDGKALPTTRAWPMSFIATLAVGGTLYIWLESDPVDWDMDVRGWFTP